MVVDDSAIIRGLIARSLEADSEIEVVSSVSNGELAVKAAARHQLDVVVLDIEMPVMEPGDLVAIPSSGAYAPSMASNYNLNPRPAIVMVRDGEARLIRRRETYSDLMLQDIF